MFIFKLSLCNNPVEFGYLSAALSLFCAFLELLDEAIIAGPIVCFERRLQLCLGTFDLIVEFAVRERCFLKRIILSHVVEPTVSEEPIVFIMGKLGFRLRAALRTILISIFMLFQTVLIG